MTDLTDVTDQCSLRTAEMREIARGIWDTEERANLWYLSPTTRLARAMNAKDIRVLTPVRNRAEPGLWSPPSKQ